MSKKTVEKIFDLKDKNVIITGSAGRLGSRFSEILSTCGSNVIMLDIDEKENLKLYNKINKQFDTDPLAVTCDITQEDQIKNSIKTILKKYNSIDVLINNAYIFPRNNPKISVNFEVFPSNLWEQIASQNLHSVFLCTREFGKIMSKQKQGNIVNISSIYGILAPDQRIYGKSGLNAPGAYSVAKGGLVNFTKYWHHIGLRKIFE